MSEGPQQIDTLYEDQAKLTLQDRINYPYLMGEAIRNYLNTTIKPEGEFSPQECLNAALNCLGLVPDSWKIMDEQFELDLKAALIVKPIDSRGLWCGVKVGVPTYKYRATLRPDKVFHAVINLLQRRGLMEKSILREIATGETFDTEDYAELRTEEQDGKVYYLKDE